MAKRRVGVACALVVLAVLLETRADQASLRQSPPAFRTQVVFVPIDVRVLDSRGNPVTDLTRDDFTVSETGVKQDILHFTARSPSAAATPRTFAIVLGRGHLNAHGNAVTAVRDFVRSRLQREDRVCVFALLRATEPTTEREGVIRLLEEYSARHEEIEDRLTNDERRNPSSDGFGRGPTQRLSDGTREAIASLFEQPGLPAVHELPGTSIPLPYSDAAYLRWAIEVLRHVEGEKHLVLISEWPPDPGPRYSLPSEAAAARVTVSVIQTGGVPGSQSVRGGRTVPIPSLEDFARNAAVNRRAFAEQTGGMGIFYESADKALMQWATATSFQYSLGYYPKNPPKEGQFRQVRVSVKRRGTSLLYRHGYAAESPGLVATDLRGTLIRNRIFPCRSLDVPARSWSIARPWMPVTELSAVPTVDRRMRIQMAFNPLQLTFARTTAGEVAALEVAVCVDDAMRTRLAERLHHVELTRNSTGAHPSSSLTGSPCSIAVDVAGQAATMRVMVYEYATDRLYATELRFP